MNRFQKIGLPLIAGLGVSLLVFLGLYLYTWGNYTVAKVLPDAAAVPMISITEAQFHGELLGPTNAPLLIVVHDGPGSDYRTLLPLKALTDKYRILFYDQLGTGLSPRADAEQLSIDKSLERLAELVDIYGQNQPVTLIGHGWGGMLAAGYAGAHPDKIARLALLEPGFLNEQLAGQVLPAMSKSSLGFVTGTVMRWVKSLHVSGPDDDARQDFVFARVRHQPAYYCDSQLPENWREYNWRTGFRAWKTITQSTLDEKGTLHLDFTKGLKDLNTPVLLVASQCNKVTGSSFQARQKRLFQSARVKTIPRSGHELLMDNPEDTLKALREYLDDYYEKQES